MTNGDSLNQAVETFCVCRVAPPRERTSDEVKNKGPRYSSSDQAEKAFCFYERFAKEKNEEVGKTGGKHERFEQADPIGRVEKQIGNEDRADRGDPRPGSPQHGSG